MVKKLTRHGNSRALVLDKPILQLLRIQDNTPLEVSTDGASLLITPIHDAPRAAKFRRALAAANRRYGRALRQLAE